MVPNWLNFFLFMSTLQCVAGESFLTTLNTSKAEKSMFDTSMFDTSLTGTKHFKGASNLPSRHFMSIIPM